MFRSLLFFIFSVFPCSVCFAEAQVYGKFAVVVSSETNKWRLSSYDDVTGEQQHVVSGVFWFQPTVQVVLSSPPEWQSQLPLIGNEFGQSCWPFANMNQKLSQTATLKGYGFWALSGVIQIWQNQDGHYVMFISRKVPLPSVYAKILREKGWKHDLPKMINMSCPA